MQEKPPEFDEAQFYASAHRPKLTNGCDRPLFSALLFGSLMIPYWNQTAWSLVAGVVVFFVGRYWLRKLGKHDPLGVRVHLRRLSYYGFYSARTKYAALLPRLSKKWVRS